MNLWRNKLVWKTGEKGAAFIAFPIIPVLEDPFTSAKPMPELFTQGWQRAGHPDLFLSSVVCFELESGAAHCADTYSLSGYTLDVPPPKRESSWHTNPVPRVQASR